MTNSNFDQLKKIKALYENGGLTEAEYNDGIILNAINIDIHMGQGFISELESLDKNKKNGWYLMPCFI